MESYSENYKVNIDRCVFEVRTQRRLLHQNMNEWKLEDKLRRSSVIFLVLDDTCSSGNHMQSWHPTPIEPLIRLEARQFYIKRTRT